MSASANEKLLNDVDLLDKASSQASGNREVHEQIKFAVSRLRSHLTDKEGDD